MNPDDFVEVAKFGSALEAESIGHALDQYDIPFIVKGDSVFFGQGPASTSGATLWVPRDRADEVAALLSCVVKPLEPEDDGSA
jgi:hypothetical protein